MIKEGKLVSNFFTRQGLIYIKLVKKMMKTKLVFHLHKENVAFAIPMKN
jgi:hypothetical protein